MIPYLLDETKTLQALAADRTNGLGALPECIEATVTQERNGAFTFRMRVPMSAKRYPEIKIGGIVKAKVDDESDLQMFRISKISKPISGIVTVDANHISYDLGKTSVLPFQTVGAAATMAQLKARMIGGTAFTLSTDINNPSSAFSNTKPQSLRALLGGQQGSVLDVFGGEFVFDNLQVILKAHRGNTTGIELRYGKNITDLKQDENIENTYTAVMPYAIDSTGNAVVGTLQFITEDAEPKILNLDLSSSFQTTTEAQAITVDRLNELAQAYIQSNNIGVPKTSITVSFINLAQTEEYKDIAPLERVRLCDTVTVNYEKLGVSATAKVVRYEYNVLTERYNSIDIGDVRSNLASTIATIAQNSAGDAVQNAQGYLDSTISAFTDLIANGLGLFVTKEAVGETGGVKIYLHNKPTRAESQYQWTINASGFAVSTDYGETWSAGIDAEGNAIFNSIAANQVNAMEINGSTITGSVINGSQFNSENQNYDLTIDSAVTQLRYNNYLRYYLYQNQYGGLLDLYSGSGTQALYTPSDGNRMRVSPGQIYHSKYYDSGYGSEGINFGVSNQRGGMRIWALKEDGTTQTEYAYIFFDETTGITIGAGNTSIRISPSGSLGIWINGSGYDGLHFVNDGNGHAVLGV